MKKFDKVSGHVGYNDAAHTYENIKSGKRYTSVTTLIHKYVPEFKGHYWSLYKACKDVLEETGDWYAFKRRAGGWEEVVGYYEKEGSKSISAKLRKSISNKQLWYLDKWEADKNSSCELGTSIHNELEAAAFHSQRVRDGKINYSVTEEDILDLQDFNSNGLYPELLVYSDEYMVSGQIDNCFRAGMVVHIHDYKTCKAIDTEGFRGETLLAPLGHIPNANYWIYALQLSMYAYILELRGFTVGNLEMHWIHGKDREDKQRNVGVKTFKLPYLKEDIIRILELNKK